MTWKRDGTTHLIQGTQVAVWNEHSKIRIIIEGGEMKEVKRVQGIVYAILTALDDSNDTDIYTGSPVRE